MKTARIGFMVLAIALLMFMAAPYASAQAIEGVWFKGSVSMKGYEMADLDNTILGKNNGKGTLYVNIVHGTDVFTVTTCTEDRVADNVWHVTEPTTVDVEYIYPGEKNMQVWDLSFPNGMSFYPDAFAQVLFTAQMNDPFDTATKISFKSFACIGYDNSSSDSFALGSCSISFKNIDPLKVPRGATGCIIP
jgi:hypothetical protein